MASAARTGTTKYLAARTKWRARWMRAGRPCAICGKPINWDAGKYEPDSFMFGHVLAVVEHGEPSRYDDSTMRPEHRRCGIIDGQLARDRARAKSSASEPIVASRIHTGHGFTDDRDRLNPTSRGW